MKKGVVCNAICILIIGLVIFSSMKRNEIKNNIPVGEDYAEAVNEVYASEHEERLRAVWVPFTELNMKGTDYSEQAFKNKFDNIIKVSKEHGINALVTHVRPFGDALYASKIFPWSHIVSKNQGENPGYDPLKYMVDACHRAGLKIHAWVNPLRVQKNNTPSVLSAKNQFVRWEGEGNEKFLLKVGNDKFYNPASSEVREMIINGVAEIVENYDVDGIQFDDYFYPQENISGELAFCATYDGSLPSSYDSAVYGEYCKGLSAGSTPLPILQWRMANVNTLICGCYSKIKSINKNVLFGISPQCNVKNDENMGADVYRWGSVSGYVDYLFAHVYVNFENPILPFRQAVDLWRGIVSNKDVKLYYGLAAYKAGSDKDKGTWLKSNEILKNEVEYCNGSGCDGFMIYSFENLCDDKTKEEIKNVMSVLS